MQSKKKLWTSQIEGKKKLMIMLFQIFTLTYTILSIIIENTTTKDIWNTLMKLYNFMSLYTRICLKRNFYTLNECVHSSEKPHQQSKYVICPTFSCKISM